MSRQLSAISGQRSKSVSVSKVRVKSQSQSQCSDCRDASTIPLNIKNRLLTRLIPSTNSDTIDPIPQLPFPDIKFSGKNC